MLWDKMLSENIVCAVSGTFWKGNNMDEKKIARINELYHKSKAEGLTDKEKEEQKTLREEYLASIRNNIRSQLDNVTIVNPDGTMIDLGKTHGRKRGH